MVRTSMLYFLAGFILGAAMLSGYMPAAPALLPMLGIVHAHVFFVGWLLQFALGIAYWLLPRRRGPDRPNGYSERWAFTAYVLLNLGLLMRVVFEPLQAVGGTGMGPLLTVSAGLQLASALILFRQIWRRASGRPGVPSKS
jgi:hypothetical protein